MRTITFTEGVPARISVADLLPAGADRYHGGFFCDIPKVYSGSDELPGVTFDHVTKEMVYDGQPLKNNSWLRPDGVRVPIYKNPATGYHIGYESGPYNPHWQYPPRSMDIPQYKVVNGKAVQQAITGGSKHTRARYCPRDKLIHILGGDYSSKGLIDDTHQDGRMLFWNYDPVANKWALNYPVFGRVGEAMPLSPDAMGFDWDADREIWWITYGDPRSGVETAVEWKTFGGLADAFPASALAYPITDAPVFTFDPKLPLPRYNKLGIMPWNIMGPKTREHAYDRASKRLYKLDASAGYGFDLRVRWLDTALYETDPINMPWALQDINLKAIGHARATGYFESPCHVDEQKRLLYFYDCRTPAVLALTLPGHALGEHKVFEVAKLPGMSNYAEDMSMGIQSMSSSPFVWIPEHRKIAMLVEPLWEEVGPRTNSFTIDVDTGVVEDGPRFPSMPNGKPWFPGAAVWFPPTQELIVYADYPNESLRETQVQTMHAYKWVA